VREVIRRPKELQIQRRLLTGDGFGCGIVFEALLKDALDAVDIEEFETQCTLTGRIGAAGAIALRQSEQLLRRTKPAPGKLAG
jgi:hypothetical protein